MPHLLSITSIFIDIGKLKFDKLIFLNGGSYIKSYFKYYDKPIIYEFSRNYYKRERCLIIECDSKEYNINFDNHLPVIKSNNKQVSIKLNDSVSRPIKNMFISLFNFFDYKVLDQRLNFDLAFEISKISSNLMAIYDIEKVKWLKKQKPTIFKNEIDKNIRYAFVEYLCKKRILNFNQSSDREALIKNLPIFKQYLTSIDNDK